MTSSSSYLISVFAGLILFCSTNLRGQKETIVLDQEKAVNYKIVIYNDSSKTQHFAARELQHFLSAIFKVKTKIINKNQLNNKNKYFLLGEGFLIDSIQHKDTLTKDSFIKVFRNGNIFLGGKDEQDTASVKNNFYQKAENANFGTLYAVYDFLENNLGIHWFFPTYLGEYIPEKTKYYLDRTQDIVIPDFQERSFYWKTLYHDKDTIMIWMLRNKLISSSDSLFKHNWHNLLPSSLYFDSIPEIYAVVNGSRIKKVSDNKAHGSSAQLCTSNNLTINLTIKKVIDQIEKDHYHQISLSPNDGKGFCECAQCKMMDLSFGEYPEYSKLSQRIFSFYKTVSDSIFKRYPDVEVGGYAYKKYAIANENLNLSERFSIRVAVNNYGFGNDKCSSFSELRYILSSWQNNHSNIGFLSFPYGGYWVYPAIRTGFYVKLIKLLHDFSFKKTRMIFYPDWYNQGLDIWVISKLYWNTDINIDSLKSQYYNEVYPHSKNVVKQFHNYLIHRFNDIDYCLDEMTMTVNDTRNLVLSIFQKDSLLDYREQISKSIINIKPDNKERINLQNLYKVIDMLLMDYNAYTLYKINHLLPNKTEKQNFKSYVEDLRFTLCITNKSAYFNPQKSPSFYLKKINWFNEN